MSRIPGLRRLFRLDRTRDVGRAVDDELRFHFDMTVQELIAAGMSRDDARSEAERRFGDVERTRAHITALDRARVGGERRAEWWQGTLQDLRYALRGLRLKPGFTAAVVLTLGLGIGANATMFGIVDRLLFRPPAFLHDAGSVHRVYFTRTFDGVDRHISNTSYRRYLDVLEATTAFSAITAAFRTEIAVGTGDEAREMPVHLASAALWTLFDVQPVIGRFYGPAEDTLPGGATVAVLGHAYWRSRFGGRSDVINTTLRIGNHDYTIIGVAPRGFLGIAMQPSVAFIPITAGAVDMWGPGINELGHSYGWSWLELFARRKPGVTAAAATADLTHAFQASYERQRVQQPAATPSEIARPRAIAAPILRDRGPQASTDAKVATWLIGVSAIVLIIACANVGNLLLARAFGRRREIAVRLALGISRRRLLAQLLTESMLLALLGGAAGLAIAQWGGGVLRALLLPDVAWTSMLADPRILAFAATTALAAGVLTGLAPAWHAGRSDLAAALKAGVREGTYHRSRTRTALLVLQSALSVMLLVGAGLFVRSLHNVRTIRLGYDDANVLFVSPEMRDMDLPLAERALLRERLLARAAALPAVAAAARNVTVPFWMTMNQDIYVAGIDSTSRLGQFDLQAVSPTYFATMGTRLLRGRGIEDGDRQGAPLVVVVSQSMARVLWPNTEPLGQCMRVGADTMPCATVVGIAEDIRSGSLSGDPALTYYLSVAQFGPARGGLFVRTHADGPSQAEAVRRALQPLMPGTSYITVTPLQDILNPQRRPWELGATMFSLFGALALLVAAVGLYSVISYGVAQRTHELGVRVALGAQVRDVVGLVVGEGLRLAVLAVVLGVAGSLVAARWIAPLLFDTSPRDPAVYGVVAVVLLVIALAASMVPALRAARVDPNSALRSE